MFGRSWEPATATIVAKKFRRASTATGTWRYVADVATGSAPPFRAQVNQPRLMWRVVWLQEGDVVGAFADVARQKAKFDRSDPKVQGGAGRRGKDRFEEALDQPPGSPPPRESA